MPKPFSIFVLMVALAGAAWAQDKPRVLVLTDIFNEPDDEESLVRFLVYANEFDVEGLVASTSTWLKSRTREDLIRRDIAAYAEVRTNLLKHAPGFPTAEQLLAVTKTGQTNYGMAFVGAGKSSAGSQLLIDAAAKDDPRPLWISIWGGANTLPTNRSADLRPGAPITWFMVPVRDSRIMDAAMNSVICGQAGK